MPVDIARPLFLTQAQVDCRIKRLMKDMANLCDKSTLSQQHQFVAAMMLSAVATAAIGLETRKAHEFLDACIEEQAGNPLN
jgi:hypothetical protein